MRPSTCHGIALVALAGWLLLPGCQGAGLGQSEAPLRALPDAPTEWSGHYSGVTEPRELLARTSAEWEEIWQLLGRSPPQTLPGNHVGVGIFLGTRPSGGYGVGLHGYEQIATDRWAICYEEVKPDGPATRALTQPYLVTVLPEAQNVVEVLPLQACRVSGQGPVTGH